MFSRVAFLILKLLVVLFPIGAGLFLTNLGMVKLNEATIVPFRQLSNPYGFLAFSSIQLQGVTWCIIIGDQFLDIKNDTYSLLVVFSFDLINASSGEHVIGFQLPGFGEFSTEPGVAELGFRIEGYNEQGKISVEVTDEKAVLVEEVEISIVYAKFVALPNAFHYEGRVLFTWKGFTARDGYSTYSIIFPVAKTKETVHQAVYDYFPKAYAYYGDDLSLDIKIHLPEDCELRRVYPLPSGEEAMPGVGGRRLYWHQLEVEKTGAPHPNSELITVNFELRSESELRNRLFFDSGLYMGLGVSLVFGGIHEALKVAMESKRKRTE